GELDLGFHLVEETLHTIQALEGELLPRRRLHPLAKLEKLHVKMVQSIVPVVGLPPRLQAQERIGLGVKLASRRSSDGKRARDADGSERVETVGVLKDTALERRRRQPAREAMTEDGIADRGKLLLGKTQALEDLDRPLGRAFGAHFGVGM